MQTKKSEKPKRRPPMEEPGKPKPITEPPAKTPQNIPIETRWVNVLHLLEKQLKKYSKNKHS